MRKLFAAVSLSLALLVLPSCDKMNPEYEAVAQKIVAFVAQGCQFIPSPETVQGLISAWDINTAAVAATVYDQIATAVCSAVQTKAGENWIVVGPTGETVKIEGQFTRDLPAPPPPPAPEQ